ncbi:MAG: diacylglycerol kinase [Burkholderiales bacterium]|nr:diacylglycerol kinase [Burkholderiales bacterium]
MKNRAFRFRLQCALQGIFFAFRNEASFRTQTIAAAAACIALVLLRPALVWVALVLVMISLVFAAELFNTALEQVLDGLHPEKAEFIRIAKDCAAGSVLVLSLASVAVFILMLCAGPA